MPRSRNGTFEPAATAKRQARTDGIEARILAMCSKGMPTRGIEGHLRGIYGVEASTGLASRITGKIMPDGRLDPCPAYALQPDLAGYAARWKRAEKPLTSAHIACQA